MSHITVHSRQQYELQCACPVAQRRTLLRVCLSVRPFVRLSVPANNSRMDSSRKSAVGRQLPMEIKC